MTKFTLDHAAAHSEVLSPCPRCGLPCRLVQSAFPDRPLLLHDPDTRRPHACVGPAKQAAAA